MADMDLEALSQGQSLGVANDSALRRVAELCAKQVEYETALATLEERLKTGKALLRDLQEGQLPEAMDAAGLSEFVTTEGRKVKVEPYLTASLSEGRMPGAVSWLREHGHDGLVQRVVVATFPKGAESEAEQAVAALRAVGVEPKDESKVNTTSLKAWAKEMLSGGATLPLDVFGIYMGRRSVIK